MRYLQMPHNSPIVAVMVAYNPPEGLVSRVEAILAQTNALIIVDNGSEEEAVAQIKALARSDNRIKWIMNKQNAGLACALNQGISAAFKLKPEWVLLFDHDSMPEGDMIQQMLRAHAEYLEPEKIGIIAPNIRDVYASNATQFLSVKGFSYQRFTPTNLWHDEAAVVITSGSLVRASLFKQIGMMREHLFIDYIDYDFCLRMRSKDLRILLVRDAWLLHRLGEKTMHAGGHIVVSNHSASRRFTIFRNRFWLWKRYYADFPGFVLHDVMAAIFDILRIVCYEDKKSDKLQAVFKGLWAGLQKEPSTD